MYPFEIFLGMGLYEIFLTIGIVAVFFLADKGAVKCAFSLTAQKLLIVAFLVAIAFGFLGAVLFQAFYDFLKTGVFQITATTGMTFYGGLIFGVIAFLLVWFLGGRKFCKAGEEKKKFPVIADMAACLIPLAHAFGRIGCFFAGCCHGKTTDKWFGVKMLTETGWRTVVPVQLFEAAFLLLLSVALMVIFLKKYQIKLAKEKREKPQENQENQAKTGENLQKAGNTFWQFCKQTPLLAAYAVLYGIWRFCIEYARADDRGASGISFLSPSQLTAILLICVGAAWCVWAFIRQRNSTENCGGKSR